MKEMNRRTFLTLTGAAVVALSLAGCSGGPSAPPAPPAAPTGKETDLLAVINRVWKKKYEANEVAHEQLILNQDAVGAIRAYGRVFEEANETPHTLNDSDNKLIFGELNGLEDKILNKYGKDSLAGMAGISEPSTEKVVALEDEYSCEDAAVRTFVAKLLKTSNSTKAEFISIYLPVVQGKTYMTAIVFLNNKP
ncbi:MAG: twin-arginine translocation signal domain-containing protein [Faecalibacterium sp.]